MGSVKSYRQVDVLTDKNSVINKTAQASTLSELIGTIPRSYQALLGDLLTKKYRVAHKHANVMSTISMYERHRTAGSFPPIVTNSIKMPRIQFAKEWLTQTSDGREVDTSLQTNVKAVRSNLLKEAIDQKEKERDYLATLIKPDNTEWNAIVVNIGTQIASSQGGSMEKTAGEVRMTRSTTEVARADYDALYGKAAEYTYRCLALSRIAIDRAEIQKVAKLQIKPKVDDMDIDGQGSSTKPVHEIIKEEVALLRKELLKGKQKSKPKNRGKGKTAFKVSKNNSQQGKKKGKKSR